MTKPICVTADDFGYSAPVDAGILDLIERGVLSGTSCLTASPRWEKAAKRIASEHLALADFGLHLDLLEFAPLCGSHSRLILDSHLGSLNSHVLAKAINQQLDVFEQSLGRMPDYVDGHLHVHQLPRVRQALLAALVRRYGGQARKPWLRVSRPVIMGTTAQRLKSATIAALGASGLAKLAKQAGFQHNTRLLGVYDFKGTEADYALQLAAWAAAAQAHDVLMVHPALALKSAEPLSELSDTILNARLVEHAALASPAWQACMRQHDLVLARGSVVLGL